MATATAMAAISYVEVLQYLMRPDELKLLHAW